jgi:hypothetical protein
MIFKKLSFRITLLLVGQIVFGQSTEKAIEIIQPQTFYLKPAFSITGGSRQVIPIPLPKNTIRWYYCFSAYRNKEDVQKVSRTYNLFSKLSLMIDQTGTTAAAISLMGNPPGSDYCHVYLMNSINDVNKFESKTDYRGDQFDFNRQGSRKNFMSGNVDINDQSNLTGTQYLGLKNLDLNNGVNVYLQVVAIVYNEPSTNGWTGSVKQKVYEKMRDNISAAAGNQFKQSDIDNLSGCIMTKITQNYSPEQITGLAEYELNSRLSNFADSCSNELKLDFSNVAASQKVIDKSNLIGKWRDQNSTFSIMNFGYLSIQWDNGTSKLGSWKIEGNKLSFSFNSWKSADEYRIIELTDNNLRYQGIGNDTTTWNATKL